MTTLHSLKIMRGAMLLDAPSKIDNSDDRALFEKHCQAD